METNLTADLKGHLVSMRGQLKRIESEVKEISNRTDTEFIQIGAFPLSLFTNGYSVAIAEAEPACIMANTRMPHARLGRMMITIDECQRLSDLLEMSASGDLSCGDGDMSLELTSVELRVYSHDHGARIDYINESSYAWFGFSNALGFAQELRHAAEVSRAIDASQVDEDEDEHHIEDGT